MIQLVENKKRPFLFSWDKLLILAGIAVRRVGQANHRLRIQSLRLYGPYLSSYLIKMRWEPVVNQIDFSQILVQSSKCAQDPIKTDLRDSSFFEKKLIWF